MVMTLRECRMNAVVKWSQWIWWWGRAQSWWRRWQREHNHGEDDDNDWSISGVQGSGVIPNEHVASGTDEPWSTWTSLNRLRVRQGRCRAMMNIWKLFQTYVCDCKERQTMSHIMTCDDTPNCTHVDRPGYANPWRCQLCQTLGGIYLTASIEDPHYRGLDEEEGKWW